MLHARREANSEESVQPPSAADALEFYQGLRDIYAPDDRWLRISHGWIGEFIAAVGIRSLSVGPRSCLNLGSGALSYGIPESLVLHVDVHPERFSSGQAFVVADVQNLPCFDNRFATCLCVGSVLNHCDAAAVIGGISRNLAPGGTLVIEFETSTSFELLPSGQFGKQAAVITTFYQDRSICLWAYSERYVRDLLESNGFAITRRSSCHHLSPLVYLLSRNSNFAARFHVLDVLARRVPVLRRCASHVIYACQRLP